MPASLASVDGRRSVRRRAFANKSPSIERMALSPSIERMALENVPARP